MSDAQGFQIYLNNGDVFSVASLYSGVGGGLYPSVDAYGLVMQSVDIVNWLDLQPYVNADWHAHYSAQEGHTYGYFNTLKTANTRENHQAAIDFINENGTFIWGDMYNGGLYLCKTYYREGETTGAVYGLILFAGYGVDSETGNERWQIFNRATVEGYTYEEISAITIAKVGSLNTTQGKVVYGDYPYIVITAGPYNKTCKYTTNQPIGNVYSYETDGTEYKITTAWQTFPTYLLAIQSPNPSYYIASEVWALNVNGVGQMMTTSQSFGSPSDEQPSWDGYSVTGDWAGGDGNAVADDPNKSSDTNPAEGGDGIPSKKSDNSGFTTEDQFGIDATDAGNVTIFNPTYAKMRAFNNWMFQSINKNDLDSVWTNLKKMYANPQDYIITSGLIKYHPSRERSSGEEIKFNGTNTHVVAREVKQWSTLECGNIEVSEQFCEFLDYQGFSSTQIYLPYCGTYDLDQQDIMGSTINLVYNIDNLTGCCVAVLEITRADRGRKDDCAIESKLFRFTGNCMQQLPIASKDYTEALKALSTLASSAIGVGTSAASGNFAGAAGSMLNGIYACTQTGANILHASNLGQSYGMLDGLIPFLIFHRPIRAVPSEYGSRVGYPSVQTVAIGNCSGYTKILKNTNFANNIPCTDEEKQEIQNYLENGIIA